VDRGFRGHDLRVRTFREDHYVVVEIGDSGPGIPPEIRPYIFDPFSTTKDVGEGTGLGLNTVQTIVRKLGGNIQVTSKPGDTRFQVWLPWADPGEPGELQGPEGTSDSGPFARRDQNKSFATFAVFFGYRELTPVARFRAEPDTVGSIGARRHDVRAAGSIDDPLLEFAIST